MQVTIPLPDDADRVAITGPSERNLKILRESLGVRITERQGTLRLDGDEQTVGQASAVLTRLREQASRRRPMSRQELLDTVASVAARPLTPTQASNESDAREAMPAALEANRLDVYLPGKTVRPMTEGQRHYVRSILEHDLTFCVGPAGTGKTYLAVATAVSLLKRGLTRRLVLARPAVEAGERLGFLPGTMQDKVNPYLRPLLDALQDMMPFEQVDRMMAADLIEVVPLAFMRGRTLNDAVIILDEAQNTTRGQMLMFLTRLGHGSRMVVTGDTSQIDLDDVRDSGLIDALRRLSRTPGIARTALDGRDIVRHSLVQRIVEAYEPPMGPDNPKPAHPANAAKTGETEQTPEQE